jgi:hypothetical protein
MTFWFDNQQDVMAPYYGETEQKFGLPSGALGGIVAAENTPPGVTSSAGAQTQFQIIPSTAQYLGVNLNDPHSAMQGAAKYWKEQLNTFGDPGLAFASYNAGPGTVQNYLRGKGDLPATTRAYAKTALAYSGLKSDYFSGDGGERRVKQYQDAPEMEGIDMPMPVTPPAPAPAGVSFPLPIDLAQDKSSVPAPRDRTYPLIMAALGLASGKGMDWESVLEGLKRA